MKYFKWKYIERFLRCTEAVSVAVAAIIIIQIPGQINEWKNIQGERSLNILLHLDAKLKSGKNRQIHITIKRNKPLLIKNGGKFSNEDLDLYLDDITSIIDAADRDLITQDDIYNWFEDYFIGIDNNKEIKKYLSDIRKAVRDSYSGLEETIKELIEYKRNLPK